MQKKKSHSVSLQKKKALKDGSELKSRAYNLLSKMTECAFIQKYVRVFEKLFLHIILNCFVWKLLNL